MFNLLKWLFNPDRFVLYMGGGGGGGGGDSRTIQDLPEWAKPYAQQTLGMTQGLTTTKDSEGNITGPSKYETRPVDTNVMGADPLQQQAYRGVGGMQIPGQTGEASNIAQQVAYRALNDQYQPGYFGNQFQAPQQYRPSRFDYMGVNAPGLQQYQMGPAERVSGGDYNAPQMAALQEMGPFERVNAPFGYDTPEMRAAQTNFDPNLQQFQMGPAERAETQSFTQPGSAEAYMSPFMQNVVDKQTREAERQAGLAAKQERAQSIQRGAFGGGRTAVREAAAARDLAQLKSDIYGTGQQAAFQNAQQQFNAEQQARMQAQLANQQAGLTVGQQNLGAKLGIQQLGTQTGMQAALANLSNQQQAAVQNQAARLQTQGLSANQAMQAALANQQAGLTTGQQNLSARLTRDQQNLASQLQTQGLTANQAMQAALANQQAGLTTGQQNLNALLGIQQLGSGQNMQAQLANQQAYQNMLQQREASRQFGYGQQMTAAQQRAQYGQAAQQLGEQSRQFGAGYGQQGLSTALQGAGQLGNLGQQEFGQQKDIYGLQNQFGAQQRAIDQERINQRYQDFLSEQRHPYQQLEFMSNILRGTPMGTVQTMYQAPPSPVSQLAGLGMGAYGASKFFKKGGKVSNQKNAGPLGLANLSLQQILNRA